jgi:hypothetical protein
VSVTTRSVKPAIIPKRINLSTVGCSRQHMRVIRGHCAYANGSTGRSQAGAPQAGLAMPTRTRHSGPRTTRRWVHRKELPPVAFQVPEAVVVVDGLAIVEVDHEQAGAGVHALGTIRLACRLRPSSLKWPRTGR